MYLTQLKLTKSPATAPLLARFLSSRYVEHQMVWELTGAPADAKRTFLFRADVTTSGLELMVLSAEPLAAIEAPWEARSRVYNPSFRVGQLLNFKLRMSPTVDRARKDQRSVRTDLVMECLKDFGGKSTVRVAAQAAAQQWLETRAEAAGFRLVECVASNYQRIVMQEKGAAIVRVPSLDIEGMLEITDPALFLSRQCSGFGKTRFAGLGLMLVRPAVS